MAVIMESLTPGQIVMAMIIVALFLLCLTGEGSPKEDKKK